MTSEEKITTTRFDLAARIVGESGVQVLRPSALIAASISSVPRKYIEKMTFEPCTLAGQGGEEEKEGRCLEVWPKRPLTQSERRRLGLGFYGNQSVESFSYAIYCQLPTLEKMPFVYGFMKEVEKLAKKLRPTLLHLNFGNSATLLATEAVERVLRPAEVVAKLTAADRLKLVGHVKVDEYGYDPSRVLVEISCKVKLSAAELQALKDVGMDEEMTFHAFKRRAERHASALSDYPMLAQFVKEAVRVARSRRAHLIYLAV